MCRAQYLSFNHHNLVSSAENDEITRMLSRVFLAISLMATSGALAAIDFSSLPQCAQMPILNTIGRSKCDPSKPQCLCSDDVIVNDLVALVAKSCSGNDLTSTRPFINQVMTNHSC